MRSRLELFLIIICAAIFTSCGAGYPAAPHWIFGGKPMPMQYRLQVWDKNNTFRFTLGVGRPLEQIEKLVVDDAGDCQEGVISGLPMSLQFSTSDVVVVERSTDDGLTWPKIYSGFIVRPGNKKSFRSDKINLLGLSRRFSEIESRVIGKLTGDASNVAKTILQDALAQANGTIIFDAAAFYFPPSGVNITVSPDYNNVEKLLTDIAALTGMRFGVSADRKPFLRYASNLFTVSAKTQGVDLKWQTPDASKVVNGVRWVGPEVQQFDYIFKQNGTPIPTPQNQRIVHLSTNAGSSERSSIISKEIPSNLAAVKTITAGVTIQQQQYNSGGATGPYAAVSANLTDGDPNTFVDFADPNFTYRFKVTVPAGTKLYGLRFRFNGLTQPLKWTFYLNRLTPPTINDPQGTTNLIVPETQEFSLFSGQRIWGDTSATEVLIDIPLPNNLWTGYRVYEIAAVVIDEVTLNNLARSEYSGPGIDVATVTVNDIVTPSAFVQVTDTQTGTVTMPVDRMEYVRGLKTVIYAGQPRDPMAAALWAEIQGKDQKATTSAIRAFQTAPK